MTAGSRPDTVLGARLTEHWARAYTRGLSPEAAAARRDEIAADLHDHLAAARTSGIRPGSVSRAVALRMLLGVPADLSWRHHHLRAQRSAGRKENAMDPARTGQVPRVVASLVGFLVVVWSLYLGVGWTLTAWHEDWSDDRWIGPMMLGVAAVAVLGLVLLVRSSSAGAFLLAAGALGSTIWLLWFTPVPVTGLLLAAGFVWYGVRVRRAPRAPAAVTGQPVPR